MTNQNGEQAEVKNFEVENMLSEHPKHRRHTFTFSIDENEFKGHYYEDEIAWMNPHPQQMYSEDKVAKIENTIHNILTQQGISSQPQEIEMTQAFEDRLHERRQVNLNVLGREFKGFIHEGEIRWFHPHPQQDLHDEQMESIETEIHEKVAEQSKETKA